MGTQRPGRASLRQGRNEHPQPRELCAWPAHGPILCLPPPSERRRLSPQGSCRTSFLPVYLSPFFRASVWILSTLCGHLLCPRCGDKGTNSADMAPGPWF